MEEVGAHAKKIDEVKVVVQRRGRFRRGVRRALQLYGVKREITMVDTKGVVYKGRKEGMNPYKERFAHEATNRTLADAAKGVDILISGSGFAMAKTTDKPNSGAPARVEP